MSETQSTAGFINYVHGRPETALRLQPTRVFGLDAIRAAAITLVIVNHAALMMQPGWHVPLLASLAGVVGVAAFFVLSGYLVGGLLLRALEVEPTPAGLLRFWARRWLRTIPAFLAALALNAAVARKIGIVPPPLWRYMTFSQNMLGAPPTFFKEAWSLSIEEWFYFLLPLSAFVCAAWWPRMRYLGLMTGALILLVVPLGLRLASASVGNLPDMPYAPRITVLRVDAMMYGVGAIWVRRHRPSIWRWLTRGAVVVAGFGLLALAALLYISGAGVRGAPWILALWPALVSVGVMLTLPAFSSWRASGSMRHRVVGFIATGSYALYLTNVLAAHAVVAFLGPRQGADGWVTISIIGYVVLAGIGAAMLHLLVERPALRWRDRWVSVHTEPTSSNRVPVAEAV